MPIPECRMHGATIKIVNNTGCFKKSFTTLKAYRNLYRGHTELFELQNVAKHTEFYLG